MTIGLPVLFVIVSRTPSPGTNSLVAVARTWGGLKNEMMLEVSDAEDR